MVGMSEINQDLHRLLRRNISEVDSKIQEIETYLLPYLKIESSVEMLHTLCTPCCPTGCQAHDAARDRPECCQELDLFCLILFILAKLIQMSIS